MGKAEIVRIWRDVDRAVFDGEIRPLGEPAVLRGIVRQWPATQAAMRSDEALVDHVGRFDAGRPLSTYVGAPSIKGRFFYREDVRGFNFDRGEAPFRAVARKLIDDREAGTGPAVYTGAAAADAYFPGFAEANTMPLLDRVMPRLWIGNAVTISTHYDVADNIACVVAGRRRFTLFPPKEVANLYVGPLEHTISGQPVSMVDPDAPDLDRFPRFAKAQEAALTADLEPGDAIYIPTLWWHHVRSAERFNLLVNYWWSEERDGSAFECLIHGLLAIRDLPVSEREAWRAFFDHFVFRPPSDAANHLPVEARGVLGPRSPARTRLIREFLARAVNRAR